MTKEEIEHNHIKEIAEKYIHESWGTYLDLNEVDLVLAGIGVAKIISKEKDGRIEELEKENAELKSIADFQTSSNMDRYFQLKRSKEQLTKAKEVITNLVKFDVSYKDDEEFQRKNELYDKMWEEAEQFLKEV